MNLRELSYLNPVSILDIGANCGEFSKEAIEVWPGTYTFMIEANPECKELLEQTNIPFQICVLSDSIKPVIFYQRKCGGTSTGDSIYRENTDWYNDENVVKTEMMATTLDIICPPIRFDLVKIDCQGAELDILKGGNRVIGHAKYIIIEVPVDCEQPYNIGAPTRQDVMDYMKSIGFYNYKVLEDIVHPVERNVIQQDVLFTRQ